MCLAVPGRILEVAEDVTDDGPMGRRARVSFGGVVREVSLAYAPEAVVGDFVLTHVGFAIAKIDAAEAERVFALLAELDGKGAASDGGLDAIR